MIFYESTNACKQFINLHFKLKGNSSNYQFKVEYVN